MTIHRSTFRKFAYSALLLALPLNPAFAADTKAVAERLKATFENQGVTLAGLAFPVTPPTWCWKA
ncbi:hypothetical protein ACHMW4_02560 [Mesorhizobium sp. UC22_110]|uniref:hypothetical protein n=1 Tax=Mesorhizobium sp. UC22_110 TaxID=3374552 RepID=UPI0037568C21